MTRQFWLADPEPHDFPAALDYLGLEFSRTRAVALVAALKRAPTIVKGQDIIRAVRSTPSLTSVRRPGAR